MGGIEFRAWDGKNKRWASDYDNILLGSDGSIYLFSDRGYEAYLKKEDFPIEFYIGRKDKNGKKIYKGDNLKYQSSPVYTVIWQDDRWMMSGHKDGNGFVVKIPDFIEIIGNIHEGEI
jgi:hypothetical protein